MRELISPKDMLAQEKQYFDTSSVKSITVMERAAEALAARIAARVPEGGCIYFACGVGGNGGDGYAAARILSDRYKTVIVPVDAARSEDAKTNAARAEACGVSFLDFFSLPPEAPDAWCDALYGTGLSRAVDGKGAEMIRRMNADRTRGAVIISADIPSGLNGQNGRMFDPCAIADETVTFGVAKTGLFLNSGLDVCGRITVADVGFPKFGVSDGQLLEHEDLARLLPKRRRDLFKGQCGHLLIVAGSFGMAGAAVMCATAALRCGVGLLTIACPLSIVPILQTLAPQAMCVPLAEHDDAISADAVPALRNALKGKDAVVIGCGLTMRAAPEAIRAVLESGLPALFDADALNRIAQDDTLRAMVNEKHILTPHPGEARRLLADGLTDDPRANAHALCHALGGATVLYKGASCVITDGNATYVSASGCSGMARGGSGDILAGIIGALIAEPSTRSLPLSAALGSEIHGCAGECAEAKLGNRTMNALDIRDHLPDVFEGR